MSPDFRSLFLAAPSAFLVLAPDPPRFTITEVNDAYLRATMTRRSDLVGRGVFEAFPDNPDDPGATGVTELSASLERALATRRPDTMAVLKYDIRRPDGSFEERHWSPVNSPVLDEEGIVTAIIHHVEDVSDYVLQAKRGLEDAERERLEAEIVGAGQRLQRANDELRERDQRLRLVQAAGGIGSFDYDLQKDEAVCSPEYYAIFGLPDGAPINRETWPAAIHPDDRSKAMTALDRAIAERRPFDYEYRIIRADTGEIRWLSGRATIIFDRDDQPWRYVGGNIDVTDRVRAEQAVRESEARFREQFENANDYIFTADLEMRITSCNPAVAAALGHSAESLIGHSIAEFVPPDILEKNKAMLAAKLRGEQATTRYEVEVNGPGGDRLTWEINSRLTRDAQGNPTGLHAIARDITDRRRAEAALRESEERYRQIVEGAEDFAIITLDPAGIITSWNSGAERMTGYTAKEACDRSGGIFFTPEDRKAGVPDQEMNRAQADGRAVNERWHMRKDGSRFWGSGLMMRLDTESGGYLKIFRDRTAEHEAERALRERAEELQTVLDAVPAAIWIARDPDSREIVGNRRSYEVLKLGVGVNQSLSADEQVRPAGFSIFHDGRELAVDEMPVQRAATGVTVERFEEEVRFDDGSDSVHLYGNAAPLRDAQGDVRGAVAAFVDITEAKRADAALRESEARFRDLAENIPILCWMAHADGNIFWYNRRWHEYTGTTPEEQHGWGWEKVHDPEMLPAVAERWRQSLASGTPFEMTFPLRGSDGTFRPFLTRVVPIRGGSGEIVRWFGTNTDVTDLRAAEEALLVARTRAEAEAAERSAILGQLAEGVIVADGEGRITFVNEAAKRLHGVAELDVAPAGYSETYHLFREDGSPYPSEELPLARAVLHGETATDARWRIRRPDGSDVLAIGSAQPLHGPDGTRLGAVLTVRDDTARRAAEQALRTLNETLEQRVEERTDELVQAQEQLRQSQKLEAMGQLTGGVAHDFNNLLTPIIGGLDLLKRRGLGSEREQRLIDGGLQSAERAKTLVQRLLAFARRQPLQPGAVDVAGLVTGMADLIASTSGPQVRLVVDLPDALPPAKADPNQLEMAILNLSVNARDAMPNGGTLTISAAPETVEVGHRSRLRPADYLRLSVADTGVGMDEATLARSIEPFFSTKGIGKGTGLGLSMVHGLAAQLGGGFAISSRPGLGTCVDLWLPLSEELAGEAEEVGPKLVAKRGKGTALLVDDEELVRMSTADMLSEFGYQVVEVGSAAEALKELEAGLDFDLLVTDHMMPGMSGADLAREVRDRLPGKPVLIVSGYAETEGIAPDLPRLTKPFRQADLAACLSSLAAGDAGSA